ncbi:MAG: DUF2723 domain-containing protein [Anaerolineae bacterium]|nr:DUF2723 domain-containing protein [Anaerolineae bacterium]
MTPVRRLAADPNVRRLAAGLLCGLYLSRVLPEFAGPGAGIVPLFVLALAAGMAGGFALACLTGAVWPALPLVIYILYPGADPAAAGVTGVLALAAWLAAARLPDGMGWEVLVVLAAFAVYTATGAPGLLPADEGEFQLTLAGLGIAHPPGYPLYTALGWLFGQFLPGAPAHRANLFSALSAALALAVVCRAVRRETHSPQAGLAAALVLGAATSFWTTAAQAGVRPMTALFVALLLDALLAYRRAAAASLNTPYPPPYPQPFPPQGGKGGRSALRKSPLPLWERGFRGEGKLTRFALCLGLGITHHASIVFVAGIFVLALLAADRSLLRAPRRWLKPGIAFALGFLPWLYLPLRAAALGPAVDRIGADLRTWAGFWQHVLARGFAGDLFYVRAPDELLARLRTLGEVLAFQWHGLVLAAALLAALLMLWRARGLLFALGGAFALHTFVAATYRAPQTVEYMIPAYVCLAAGVGWLVGTWGRKEDFHHRDTEGAEFSIHSSPSSSLRVLCVSVVNILTALVLLGGALTAAANLPGMVYRAGDAHTRRFAESLLDAAPPDAVLLANWHWSTALWYLQEIEARRPDVAVVYVYPAGAEPLAATWARRAGEYLAAGRPVVVQSYYPDAYAASGCVFEPQVGGPGWVVRRAPRRDIPPELPPLAVDFAGGVRLAGGPRIDAPGGYAPVTVTLAWRVDVTPGQDVTSFIHAVDGAGQVVRQDDVRLAAAQARPGDILLARYTLDRLPAGVELWAGLYTQGIDGITPLLTAEGGARVRIARYDGGASPRAALPVVTEHPRHDRFEDGLTLTGYDYDLSLPGRARLYLHWSYRGAAGWADYDITLSRGDVALDEQRFRAHPGDYFSTAHDLPPGIDRVRLALQAADCLCLQRVMGPFGLAVGYSVDLPGPQPGDRYVPLGSGVVLTGVQVDAPPALTPGARIETALRFRAAYPLAEDDVVKVDLIESEWAWRAQSDHVPATGAIPTLKWTWGSTVTDRHTLVAPDQAAEGQRARLELLVYDHFTGRPLPILDPALAARGQTLTIWASDAP